MGNYKKKAGSLLMSTELEQLYTFQDAMAYLRLSRSTVQRLIQSGRLVGGKVGGEWRFTKEQLEHSIQPVSLKQVKIEQGEEAT